MKRNGDVLQSEIDAMILKNTKIKHQIEEITSNANYYFGIWSLDSANGRLSLNPGFIICVVAISVLFCLVIYLIFCKYHERRLEKLIYDLDERLKYL